MCLALRGRMACTVCVQIQAAMKSRHETWASAARNTWDHRMIDFELISGQCVSTRSRPAWAAGNILSDILLLHATHSRLHTVFPQQGTARISFGVFGDSSPEPKDNMTVQVCRTYFHNPLASCAQPTGDNLTGTRVTPQGKQRPTSGL